MKKLLIATVLATPLAFSGAKSYEFPEKLPYGDISANIGHYSQYVWRGEQQNAGQSAVQGGLDYGVTLLDTYVDFYGREVYHDGKANCEVDKFIAKRQTVSLF